MYIYNICIYRERERERDIGVPRLAAGRRATGRRAGAAAATAGLPLEFYTPPTPGGDL